MIKRPVPYARFMKRSNETGFMGAPTAKPTGTGFLGAPTAGTAGAGSNQMQMPPRANQAQQAPIPQVMPTPDSVKGTIYDPAYQAPQEWQDELKSNQSWWNRSAKPLMQSAWEMSGPGMIYNAVAGNEQALDRGLTSASDMPARYLDAGKGGVNNFATGFGLLGDDILEREERFKNDPYQNWAGRALGVAALAGSLAAGGAPAAGGRAVGAGGSAATQAAKSPVSRFLTQGVGELVGPNAGRLAQMGSQAVRGGVNFGISPINPVPLYNMTRLGTGSLGTQAMNALMRGMAIPTVAGGVNDAYQSASQYAQDNPEAGTARLAWEAAKGPLSRVGFYPLPTTSGVAEPVQHIFESMSGEEGLRNALFADLESRGVAPEEATGLTGDDAQLLPNSENFAAYAPEFEQAAREYGASNSPGWNLAARAASIPAWLNNLNLSNVVGQPYSAGRATRESDAAVNAENINRLRQAYGNRMDTSGLTPQQKQYLRTLLSPEERAQYSSYFEGQ